MGKGIVLIDEEGCVFIAGTSDGGRAEFFEVADQLSHISYGGHLREPITEDEWAHVDQALNILAELRHPCLFGNGHHGKIIGIERRNAEFFATLAVGDSQTITRPFEDINFAPPPTALY